MKLLSGLSTIASSLESKIDDVGGFPSSCSSSSSSSSSYDNSQLLDNRPIQAGAISTSNGSPDVSESTSSTSSTPVTFTPTLNPVEVFNQNSSTITNSNSTTSTTCASTTVTTSTTTTTTVTISTPNSSQMRVSSSKVLDRNQHIAQVRFFISASFLKLYPATPLGNRVIFGKVVIFEQMRS